MAQLGKGKLNYRCPSCFLRDLDIDMFYNKETGIYSCIRCQYRGTEQDVLEKNEMIRFRQLFCRLYAEFSSAAANDLLFRPVKLLIF